ncbi:MAG: tryptophanase [Acholeplasmataceae bacterium]|nr:tryptophanase [Acholeplasmataceae bacterium]
MKHTYRVPPYRIKMVEPIRELSKEARISRLEDAGFNPFSLSSSDVFIDLLTDSGTGAMSHHQWAALMSGDESYAGSSSFYRLEAAVKDITGYKDMMPVHQGRGAEQVVIPTLVHHEGMVFLSNTHFDTTRAHVELTGSEAIDLETKESLLTETPHPFKGNIDLGRLKNAIDRYGTNIAGLIMTVTNNSVGGQPVSLENFKAAAALARAHGIPVIMDGARYAENAYFIKTREEGYQDMSVKEIAKHLFDEADIFLMSAKKDGLVNIGGLIAVKDDSALFERLKTRMVPMEGFPTYGGLAGRDMEALAVGLYEALDDDYLQHRIDQVRYLGDRMRALGIPIQYPTGGHAVFVDCTKMVPHIPFDQFPAQAVVNELYLEGGIRAVEIGSFMMGRDPKTGLNRQSPIEFVRLAIPRRTYTYAHLDYVAEAFGAVYQRRAFIKGLKLTYEPPVLRHFTARLAPLT